jgi:hypothetical protein
VKDIGNKMNGIEETITSLLNYCQGNEWAGFDPYDALNSRLFAHTPFARSRICRIALTQILKRLPINIRPLLGITREQNPKGLALFLKAFLKLEKTGFLGREDLTGLMIDRLEALRSQGSTYWCWGYSFPWQTRTILVPKGAPNLVCTVFVADSLLDAYEVKGDERSLRMAVSAAEYILNELFWTDGDSTVGFSYPLPGLQTRVHNANFLGAALFCRIYKLSGEEKFLGPALKIARYSAAKQQDDGSWDYGEFPKQRWVDNFHTGYNLCALRSIGQNAKTSEFVFHIRRGFEFYQKHFFTDDNAPKYFHDRSYPIDIHSAAQSIITLLEFSDLDAGAFEQACSVFEWAMEVLWDKRGYFYYRALPLLKNKISYMRWSQAWMLLALSTFHEQFEKTSTASTNSVQGHASQLHS